MADPAVVFASDDDARAAGEFRWLGPAGHRFRHDHRGTSYVVAVTLGLAFALIGALAAPTWLPGGLVADGLLRILTALIALWPANKLARSLMRHVDLERTVRWHARTLQLEVNAPRPERGIDSRLAVRPFRKDT